MNETICNQINEWINVWMDAGMDEILLLWDKWTKKYGRVIKILAQNMSVNDITYMMYVQYIAYENDNSIYPYYTV